MEYNFIKHPGLRTGIEFLTSFALGARKRARRRPTGASKMNCSTQQKSLNTEFTFYNFLGCQTLAKRASDTLTTGFGHINVWRTYAQLHSPTFLDIFYY